MKELIKMTGDRKKYEFVFGLSYSKYILFALNVVFAMSSVLIISGGISTYIIFGTVHSHMSMSVQLLSTYWLAAGIILMFVASLGFFAAFKESAVIANLYGIAEMFALLSLSAAAITGYTLLSRSKFMVSNQLTEMMQHYTVGVDGNFGPYGLKTDWIQSTFECCGNNEPSDWQDLYASIWILAGDKAAAFPDKNISDKNLLPPSCCVKFSNYVNLTCESYYRTGCFEPVHQIVRESIMWITFSAVGFAVVQILGAVVGFIHAKNLRREKTLRYMKIWNVCQEYSDISTPAYANYLRLGNHYEAKYI